MEPVLAQAPAAIRAIRAASAVGAAAQGAGVPIGRVMPEDNLKCAGPACRSSQLNQPDFADFLGVILYRDAAMCQL